MDGVPFVEGVEARVSSEGAAIGAGSVDETGGADRRAPMAGSIGTDKDATGEPSATSELACGGVGETVDGGSRCAISRAVAAQMVAIATPTTILRVVCATGMC